MCEVPELRLFNTEDIGGSKGVGMSISPLQFKQLQIEDRDRRIEQKDAEIAALKGATKYDELMRDPVFKKAYAKEFAADDRARMETEIARLSSLLDRLNEKLERYELKEQKPERSELKEKAV